MPFKLYYRQATCRVHTLPPVFSLAGNKLKASELKYSGRFDSGWFRGFDQIIGGRWGEVARILCFDSRTSFKAIC